MKVDKRANFCIFFVIAILALGLSNFAAGFTGDFVSASFPGVNDTDKMIALDDDNFAPIGLNAVYEKKVVEEVNETENDTDANSTIDEKVIDDSDNDDDYQEDDNDYNNQDSDSDSNNRDNGGGGSSDSTPSEAQTDDGDGE